MASQTCSVVRFAALRSQCLSLAKSARWGSGRAALPLRPYPTQQTWDATDGRAQPQEGVGSSRFRKCSNPAMDRASAIS
jgi:hypothetical protein